MRMSKSPPTRRLHNAALAVVATAAFALLLPATSAPAFPSPPPPSITGVWSFNGGKVAIQQEADGEFTGTVVAATRFAECQHPVGEVMWTGMRATVGGAYYGFHQWFFEGPACVPNPQLGFTAWRLMEAPGHEHFLRACFSEPGKPQPEISPTGTATNASYGCADSALLAPAPATSGTAAFRSAVSLPSSTRCLSRRDFTIHLRDPRNDPLREVVVTLAGRRLRTVRRGNRFASKVDLRGLPRGTFTVRIELITVLGHRLTGRRTYHTCVSAHNRSSK
jgi:hypothetical protein